MMCSRCPPAHIRRGGRPSAPRRQRAGLGTGALKRDCQARGTGAAEFTHSAMFNALMAVL